MSTLLIFLVIIVLGLVLGNLFMFSGKINASESINIAVDPDKVFAAIIDLRDNLAWHPRLQTKDECAHEFSDASDQKGSRWKWSSKKIGTGELTNVSLDRPHSIVQNVQFLRPRHYQIQKTWQFEADDSGTKVTCNLAGRMPFVWRIFAGKTKHMLAGDCRYGLELLRQKLDPTAPRMKLTYSGISVFPAMTCAMHPFVGSFDEMRTTMRDVYPKLAQAAAGDGDGEAAAEFRTAAIYNKVNFKTNQVDLELVAPTAKSQVEGFTVKSYPAGMFCQIVLAGNYDFLDLAWTQAFRYLQINKLKFDWRRPAMDVYQKSLFDCDDPDEYITCLYLPVKG